MNWKTYKRKEFLNFPLLAVGDEDVLIGGYHTYTREELGIKANTKTPITCVIKYEM